MNEANVGLLALAHQLAPDYCTNPKVAAMAIERSVACGYADRFSDLDLVVFWSQPPTEKEGTEIVKHAGGRHLQLVPSIRGGLGFAICKSGVSPHNVSARLP
jgi:hypothetical protein